MQPPFSTPAPAQQAPTPPPDWNLSWTQTHRRQDYSPSLILAAAGWHEVRSRSRWDGERLLADHAAHLLHSSLQEAEPHPRPFRAQNSHFFFALPDGVLLALTRDPVVGDRLLLWAPTAVLARETYLRLRERYALRGKPRSRAPVFYVLRSIERGVGVQPITLPRHHRHLWQRRRRGTTKGSSAAQPPRSDTEFGWLARHYGPEFPAWHTALVTRLRTRDKSGRGGCGLTLLRGEPGTGKTTYVRYLLWTLRRTHRFYFLPTAAFALLGSPATMDFWLQEGRDEKGRGARVLILEDAERLLMERAADNQDRLSTLLNLADGFLGDALQLHVVCTVNAPLERLDPALLRPGRLLASHSFERFTREQAQTLAQTEGFPLAPATSEDGTYSLAELYAGATVLAPASPTPARPRAVGF